jgi:hypothetical protein
MSFATISRCAADDAFGQRVRAGYAKEGVDNPDPAYYAMRWVIAADPSVEAPYESAVIAENPNPGGDEAVVTDGMLTAAIQAHPYTPPP